MVAVNQAIGALITRGLNPAQAHTGLHRRPPHGRVRIPVAARRYLDHRADPPRRQPIRPLPVVCHARR